MNDKYYRDLIEKVISANAQYYEILHNENDIRDPIGNAYEYYNELSHILYDEDLTVHDQTYFEALALLTTFFCGERQDTIPVWGHIVKRYKEVLQRPKKIDSFNKAFMEFLKDRLDGRIPTLGIFYELMHLAIKTKSLDITCELLWLTPTEIECWGQLEEIYEYEPEWAAYIECLSDITYERFPDDLIFKETVRNLYLAFGDYPDMEKLRALNYLYY